MGRKIRMTKTVPGAPEHVITYLYREGETYEVGSNNQEALSEDALEGTIAPIHPMSESLATSFVRNGDAEEAGMFKTKKSAETE